MNLYLKIRPSGLLLLLAILLLGPLVLSAQNQPQRVLVVQFQHYVSPAQEALYPDYFAYDPAWTQLLGKTVDSLLQVRLGQVQVRFRQQEAVQFVSSMFPEVARPFPGEREQFDRLVWIYSSIQPGSHSLVGSTEKINSRLVLQVRMEDAKGKKLWQEKVVSRFGSVIRKEDLRPLGQQLIGPADFRQLYGQALRAVFLPKPPKLPFTVVTPPAFDPIAGPVSDLEEFMTRAETGRLLQKNSNLFLHNAGFFFSQTSDSSTVSTLDLREEVAADRLAGALATGIVNDVLGTTVVHKVKRFELQNNLSRTPYRIRVMSEVIGAGVDTRVAFLQDKKEVGSFRLVGHQSFEGTFDDQKYYLTYNPTLDRVLIYEDEGLSVMVNQGPKDRSTKLFPYDLYFYEGLPKEKKAALLNVYLGFRLAKLLEANAIDRKIEKETDALEGRQ